jgi:hypothetical protein
MGHPTDDDIALPTRHDLTVVLAKLKAGEPITDHDREELIEGVAWALGAVSPEVDFVHIVTRNPMHQVFFRAGLLACREYMARFVEQGGHLDIAHSIRANWWPVLGDDPGPPRLFAFGELADEVDTPDGPAWKMRDVPTSVEALPRAFQFLQGKL